MEIAPVPRRRVWSPRAWALIVTLLFVPVTALVVVPTVMGWERYVVSSDAMGGTLSRGTLVFARVVPAGDVRVGDVVTFDPPGDEGDGLVTQRVVGVRPGALLTRADDQPDARPRRVLVPDHPTVSRMVVAVPGIGLPFLLTIGTWAWIALVLVAGGALAAFVVQDRRQEARRRNSAAPPVGEIHRVGP